MKVIVIVVIAIAVVLGVLLLTYCLSKRTNFRGNISLRPTLEMIFQDCLIELLETYIVANKMWNKKSYEV